MSATLIEEQPRTTGAAVTAPPILVVNKPAGGAGVGLPPGTLPADAPPRRSRKPIVLGVLLTVAVVAGLVTTLWLVHASGYESTDDAAIDGHVVTISPQVSAAVKAVHIDDNTFVRKGDPMVDLDPTDYQVALDQATATEQAQAGKVTQAETEIESAKATREAAAADVEVAQANADNAHADFGRYVALSNRTPGAVSKMQFDQSTSAEAGAAASVKQAKAKLAQAVSAIATKQAMLVAAQGDVAKARADVHRARVNLDYCTIVAPADGRVTRKNVEPGSYVQTGEQLFAVVPTNVWVVANFKETQLDRMRKDQPVTISVDAYPGLTLHGHVDSFQAGTGSRFSMLPAENATGNYVKVVQRVPVKILLDGYAFDRDHPLSPGMSVEPEVSLR